MQHQPVACASNLGDGQSRYLLNNSEMGINVRVLFYLGNVFCKEFARRLHFFAGFTAEQQFSVDTLHDDKASRFTQIHTTDHLLKPNSRNHAPQTRVYTAKQPDKRSINVVKLYTVINPLKGRSVNWLHSASRSNLHF